MSPMYLRWHVYLLPLHKVNKYLNSNAASPTDLVCAWHRHTTCKKEIPPHQSLGLHSSVLIGYVERRGQQTLLSDSTPSLRSSRLNRAQHHLWINPAHNDMQAGAFAGLNQSAKWHDLPLCPCYSSAVASQITSSGHRRHVANTWDGEEISVTLRRGNLS